MANNKPRRADHTGQHRTTYNKNRQRILSAASSTLCPLCGLELDTSIKDKNNPLYVEVDHIIPISRGGHPSDIDNLQAVHRICNRKKSDRTLSEMLADVRCNSNNEEDIRFQVAWSEYRGE